MEVAFHAIAPALMLEKDASDHTRCYCNKQEVSVIAAHPVVTPRRLAQIMVTPVRHHILVAAIIAWHHATASIPAFVIASIMHDHTVPTIAALTMII